MHVANKEVRPKEIQKLLDQSRWYAGRGFYQQTGIAFDETGKIHTGKYRAFWTCSAVLLPFHITDPKIPGSSDPSDHQRDTAWKDE